MTDFALILSLKQAWGNAEIYSLEMNCFRID